MFGNKFIAGAAALCMTFSCIPSFADELEGMIPAAEITEATSGVAEPTQSPKAVMTGSPVPSVSASPEADPDQPQAGVSTEPELDASLEQLSVERSVGDWAKTVYDTPEEYLEAFEDPDWITDETFYGKYDQATGKWTNTGYFNYEKYPDMKPVQEAAKIGDYDGAKAALLEYYREVFQAYQPGVIGGANKVDRLTTHLMEYNMHWNENSNMLLLGSLTFGTEAETRECDLIEDISSIIKATDRKLTVYLIALRKDGSYVSIDSKDKEGGIAPTLSITTASGDTKIIEATEDAYVSPSENKGNNYGRKDEILVEESVSSIKQDLPYAMGDQSVPVDKNTKRGFLKFDLSEIASDASVTSASLQLHGRAVNSEAGEEKIVAFKIATNSWTEDNLTYYKAGNAGIEHTVFSWDGENSFRFINSNNIPKDNGTQFCSARFPEEQLRFNTWLKHAVGMFTQALDNNEHYAAVGLRQWGGFLEQRGSNPGFIKGLDVSVRSADMPRFLKYLIQSEHMTPELWSATAKNMWGALNDMNGRADQNNNWRTFEVRGMNSVNCYFHEFRKYDTFLARLKYYAKTNVYGDKPEDPTYTPGMILPDGASKEGAIGYGIYALDDMLNFDQANRETGQMSEEELPFIDGADEQIHKSVLYTLYMTMPGYRDNQMGDGGVYTSKYASRFKAAGEKFDDPYLLYAGTDGQKGEETPVTSARYYSPRRYAMRTGWDDETDLYLYTSVSGGYNSHGHFDDNNIIMYAYGNYLLTDQMYYTYTNGNSIRNELISTRMHNTVTIDNTSQSSSGRYSDLGKENRWESNNSYDMSSLTPVSYKNTGVDHTRNILYVKPGFWIVTDFMDPPNDTGSHNYKQNWHMLPTANMSYDPVTKSTRSNFSGKSNIIVAQSGIDSLDGTIQTGKYSEGTNSVTDADYMQYEKKGTGNQRFDTVLYPEDKGHEAEVSITDLAVSDITNNGAGAMKIDIEDDYDGLTETTHGYYYSLNDAAQKRERAFGSMRTDSVTAYVEMDQDDYYTRYIMQDGTILSNGDDILIKTLESMPELAIDISSSKRVDINSSNDIDLEKLTFYSNEAVKEVYLNGQPVKKFKMAGNYVYFGDTPIIGEPGDPEPTVKPTPSSKPSTGGGGGGVNHSGGSGVVMPPSVPPSASPATPTPTPDTVTPETVERELEGHWGAQEIKTIYDKGILKGKEGSLALEEPLTRAEFATMLLRSMDVEPTDYQGGFSDVTEDAWYAGYLQAAYDNGILGGGADGEMMPDSIVTREQMVKMIVDAYEKMTGEAVAPSEEKFDDDGQISAWANEYIYKAKALGLLTGDDNNNVDPARGTKRDEGAVVLYRLLEKGGRL